MAAYWLLPLSLLYRGILWIRNTMYDKGVLKSRKGAISTIVIGNLELGGTGKTPVTDYVLRHLSESKKAGMISRGYGRSTNGFHLVESHMSPDQCGDEPLMLKIRNPHLPIAVCENRLSGIERIKLIHKDLDVMVADDAFQHRKLAGNINILCTLWQRPFFLNQVIPSGTLRDHPIRARAADLLMVNKCPDQLTESEMKAFMDALPQKIKVPVVFTYIKYASPKKVLGGGKMDESSKRILLTGIANPHYFKSHVEESLGPVAHHFKFKDHHRFSTSDFEQIRAISNGNSVLITTEKDLMRLRISFENELQNLTVFVIEIELGFHGNGKQILDACLSND